MKEIYRAIKKGMLCLVIALCLTWVSSATGTGMGIAGIVAEAASPVKINKTQAKIRDGEQLALKLSRANVKQVSWASHNLKVAEVSEGGVVRAKAPGNAVITAVYNNKTYKCKVTVTAYGVYPKTLTLKVGQSRKLKVKGMEGSQKWSSSDPSVVTVKKGNLVAKRAGKAKITVTIKKKKFICNVTVKNAASNAFDHNGDQTSDGSKDPTSADGDGSEEQPKSKYHYELYTLDVFGGDFYSGVSKPIYLKTDNPNAWSIVLHSNKPGTNDSDITMCITEYDDVQYTTSYSIDGWYKVDGGYLGEIEFETPGVHTVTLVEKRKDSDSLFFTKDYPAGTFTVNVLDTAKLESQWMDQMIEKYTNPSMNPVEKMNAICQGVGAYDGSGYFKYHDIYQDAYLYLVQNWGVPYFVRRQANSAESPDFLCRFAEKVGGFTNIHDCYDDYPVGSDGWRRTHYLMTSYYQGVKYSFSACPSESTNVHESYEMYDFTDTSAMRRYF